MSPRPMFRSRTASGRRIYERRHWCTRGGLITVVFARSFPEARHKAGVLFRQGFPSYRGDDSLIRVRVASRADVAAWDLLIEQQRGGRAGAELAAPIADEQGSMFDVA